MEVRGKGDRIPIATLSPQNDFCFKVGSDESHFITVKDKVTRQCPQTATFCAEKGEPKQIRTEVPLLTSLTPYRQAKPAHVHRGGNLD